jgi:hypothetical protein
MPDTQLPPPPASQSSSIVHAQAPCVQTNEFGHVCPHAPQFSVLFVETHSPPQHTCPPWHPPMVAPHLHRP